MSDCLHHWIIEAATGPVSKGKCKLCGNTQEFSNRIGGKTIGRVVPDSLTIFPRKAAKIKDLNMRKKYVGIRNSRGRN